MAIPDVRKVQEFKGYGLRCLHIKNISLKVLRKAERLMPLSGVIYVFFIKNRLQTLDFRPLTLDIRHQPSDLDYFLVMSSATSANLERSAS